MKTERFVLKRLSALIPGLALALVVMSISLGAVHLFSSVLSFDHGLLSPILVTLVLSLVIGSTVALPESVAPGLAFGVKRLLRFGIVLMGIRLSIFSVLEIGLVAIGVVVICITAAVLITVFIARRLGVSTRLGALIAAGTSICGVSAIVALSPAVGAKKEETAYAVATITLFGILATITYPYLTELVLHLPVTSAGFFLGTSIHDTSQVTAASLIYDQIWSHQSAEGLTGADIAITTKLVRNTFMVVVIPALSFWSARNGDQGTGNARGSVTQYVPFFVLGYIVMGILRSSGDHFWGGENEMWVCLWQGIKTTALYIIVLAITCVGLSTDIRKLSALGIAPFACGLVAALAVGVVSWLVVSMFGPYIAL
jgi:uncharacterized integral membrane protein (TIGR00698 family)